MTYWHLCSVMYSQVSRDVRSFDFIWRHVFFHDLDDFASTSPDKDINNRVLSGLIIDSKCNHVSNILLYFSKISIICPIRGQQGSTHKLHYTDLGPITFGTWIPGWAWSLYADFENVDPFRPSEITDRRTNWNKRATITD